MRLMVGGTQRSSLRLIADGIFALAEGCWRAGVVILLNAKVFGAKIITG